MRPAGFHVHDLLRLYLGEEFLEGGTRRGGEHAFAIVSAGDEAGTPSSSEGTGNDGNTRGGRGGPNGHRSGG